MFAIGTEARFHSQALPSLSRHHDGQHEGHKVTIRAHKLGPAMMRGTGEPQIKLYQVAATNPCVVGRWRHKQDDCTFWVAPWEVEG